MKFSRKSFGIKLWRWFILFAVVIFTALWLLQTVFLQNFYDGMVIRNTQRTAVKIAQQQDSENLADIITDAAADGSLLIFLTDRDGNIFYSADEHNSVYTDSAGRLSGRSENNPYREGDGQMGWQIGAFRNLPAGYGDFLQQLSASESGSVGYRTESGDTYIYGIMLSPSETFSGGAVLYISTPLGAVGAAARILRVQLIWVTLASLVIGFFLAYLISRQFARPVSSITAQARRMADGAFSADAGEYKKGFCSELDELSDTLDETAAALEKLENARRELLANISHDLRTPLTMIRGYAEMVQEFSWNDDSKRDEDLNIIIRETDRLTGLVQDILDYSALQSPSLTVQRVPFDFSAAAQAVIGQFIPLCTQKGSEVDARIEPGQWVCGDEEQLKRVLYNLIDNALLHAGDHREIQVTVKACAGQVRTEVRDYGEGIPKEELPLIWDRYFTAKQRRDMGGGSGLGLAITREILQKHRADFGAESEPGQGSTFWFTLEKTDV